MTDDQIQANADRAHQDMVNMLNAFKELQQQMAAFDAHSDEMSKASIAAADRQTEAITAVVSAIADKAADVTEATMLEIVKALARPAA